MELKGSKTEKNLMTAFAGESQARNKYTFYASKARKEGYLKLVGNIEDNLVFQRGEDKVWICRNCGHITVGKSAPSICPVCAHPQSFMELKAENY